MKKKILIILLISSVAITSLFAYSDKSVILEANQNKKSYSFIVQYNNTGNGNQEALYNLDFIVGGTTKAFTVETKDKGNMDIDIFFTTTLETGEFINKVDDTIKSSWYPRIIDDIDNITKVDHYEEVTYALTEGNNSEADLKAPTKATYTTTFQKGKHVIGTEIARFKLQYKGDDEIVAGKYRSTSIITIISDEV